MAEEVARIDLESDEVVQVGGYGQQVQAGAEGAFGFLGCTYGLAWSWKGTVFAPCGAGRWFRLLSLNLLRSWSCTARTTATTHILSSTGKASRELRHLDDKNWTTELLHLPWILGYSYNGSDKLRAIAFSNLAFWHGLYWLRLYLFCVN